MRRFATVLVILPLLSAAVFAQGLNTAATKDDWEEINFEFNSAVLVDGYPSLLRVADLLKSHPGYKVFVEGHTDVIGSQQYNEKLGLSRATAIKDFLVKYGAGAAQITTGTRGKVDPKYPGQRPTYSKTDEARWMNRRVTLTVMDEQGRVVGAGGAGDAIRAMEPAKPSGGGMENCCTEVLRRLDKLDDIARLLKDLADQNAAMRREIDALKQGQQVLESKNNQPAGPKGPTADEIAAAVEAEAAKHRQPKFQLLGVNIGADDKGDVTFTGKGRFFAPMTNHFAFQAQGEYLYFRGQKEGQMDLGLVDRFGRFQSGLFASFKHVSLAGNQTGGTLGQAALTMDYLFKWGKIGVFGTKGFMDNAVINRGAFVGADGTIFHNILEERFLHIVDQAGAQATFALFGNSYAEANVGYLKSVGYGDRVGGTIRIVIPYNRHLAFTVEGGMNETILSRNNNGRAVVGVQFGNMMRPKDFLDAKHPVPVDVPRVRYEVLTRRLRIGNDPPVADAGPDQIGVTAGLIQLDGSNSYDPDGDPITFQWFQEAGPAVTLSNPTASRTTFTSTQGNTYVFRLQVKDNHGGVGNARVRITTAASAPAKILFFVANPPNITSGQTSQLSWSVINADTITLSSVGTVSATSNVTVAPTVTTTYTLTAKNATSTDTATAVVVVNAAKTSLLFCFATPTNIMAGETATINYGTQNADSVSITPGIGKVGNSGNVAVSPTSTTTYTVTATGAGGTDSCSVTVSVTPGQLPRIIRFSNAPNTIHTGENSTLFWVVENADKVTIDNGVGDVSVAGSQDVSPAATTTYTLTATNKTGAVTAKTTVNVIVINPPKVVSFTATPNPSGGPGQPVVLNCQASSVTSITMAGVIFVPSTAIFTVRPLVDTVYTCIATGQTGKTDVQSLTVKVSPPGGAGTTPPVIQVTGGLFLTGIFPTVTVDASGSFSPTGNAPLTFKWTPITAGSTIVNGTTATPTITVVDVGAYQFTLTVTDSKGNSSSTVVTVRLTTRDNA